MTLCPKQQVLIPKNHDRVLPDIESERSQKGPTGDICTYSIEHNILAEIPSLEMNQAMRPPEPRPGLSEGVKKPKVSLHSCRTPVY